MCGDPTGRFWHRLKENKSTGYPRNLIFYDTETEPKQIDDSLTEHRLKLGVAWFVRREYKDHHQKEDITLFTTKDQFFDFVLDHLEPRKSTYIFSHNQNFDFAVIDGINLFNKPGWELKKFIFSNQMFLFHYKYDHNSVYFIDTLNYFRRSLAEMGKVIGLPKLEIDFERCEFEELANYCYRDVEIIKEFVLRMINMLKKYDMCYFKPTIASLADATFRHGYMTTPIMIHASTPATTLERASYRGGRAECFKIGTFRNNNFYDLDVNSMYPFVMRNYKLPYKLVTLFQNPSEDDILRNIDEFDVICHANITINQPAIAVKKDRLYFPIGTFNAYLTTPEFQYVIEHGKINEIYRCTLYEKKVLFKDYVDFFYKFKANINHEYSDFEQSFGKLLLNSLYGRFGLSIEPYIKIPGADIAENYIAHFYDHDLDKWVYEIGISGHTYTKTTKQEGKDSFVPIPSFVSAYSRMLIWDFINIAGVENTYYTDTDSLFVNQAGYDNLFDEIHATELGKLKVVNTTDYLKINNVKNYQFGYDRKIKGIRHDALSDDDKIFHQEHFFTLKGILKDGLSGHAYTKKVKRCIRGKYLKGNVDKNGNVTPFTFNEPPLTKIDLSQIYNYRS